MMIAPIRRGLSDPRRAARSGRSEFSIRYLATAVVALIGLCQHWSNG